MKNPKKIALALSAAVITNAIPFNVINANEKFITPNVIISEYLEGSSNNKAIEIFNGSGDTINLSDYTLELYVNGKSEPTGTFTLSGDLENNNTYVICHPSANAEIKAKSNCENNAVTAFNGNDALVLKQGDTVVDSFGQVGFNPGTNWQVEGVATSDMTLVRKSEVTTGDTNTTDEFDPSKEWIALPKDDTSNLGKHTMDIQNEVEGLISIADARTSTEEVIIKGKITFKESSGNLYNYAIQDSTAGITLRGADDFNIGEEVIVKGKVTEYKGLKQIQNFELITNNGQKTFPTAKLVTIADIVDNAGGENYESQVVKIQNLKVTEINLNGNTKLEDENGKFIYLYKAGDLGGVEVGNTVDVTATLSQFSTTGTDGYQLRIFHRYQVDKIKVEEAEEEVKVDKEGPAFSKVMPGSSSNIGDNKRPEISASFKDETGVDMTSVKMTFNGEDVTSKIVKEENTVKYAVEKDLEEGKHTVKVEVADTLGNVSTKEWNFTVGTQEYNTYFGQIHSHTNISDGQGTVDDAYTHAKEIAGLDFFAVTDHSNWFDNDTSASMEDGSASEEWKMGHDSADKHYKEGEFTSIYAYEMTWKKADGGHMNTFNTEGFETRTSGMKIQEYYKKLKENEGSISQFNHPGTTFGTFFDFAFYDEEIDERISLLEVGNGEGAIGSSGYFPAYEQYTAALDKGWHVSPTNSQDNHKGLWGNANTARTVALASSNTREGIYEAFTSRRTYSTEDENLKISYSVNGNVMGSILEDTDHLSFNISVADEDSSDKIDTIQVIGDGGKVVKEITNINSQSKEWNFELNESNSSYYYVKVIQKDKDIAVTAPVWVGEKTLVSLDSVEVDKDIIVENEKFNIETSIVNNESSDLENVKIEYYVNGSDKPIVKEFDNIGGGKSFIAKFEHAFETAGDYTIDVVVKATLEGNEVIFNKSIDVEIVKESQISKVVVDGAHDNAYVSGTYANSIETVTTIAGKQGTKVEVNTSEITDEVLKGASLLILSDAATGKNYTQSELAAIKRFTDNGGSILITSVADFKDAEGENGNAAQGNSVLTAIGAKLRFNDDQVVDDENYSNQKYRLYFNNYNLESEFLKGVDKELKYSFYSGCSIIMPEDMTNVEALVKGHSTTYTTDSDNAGDNTTVEKGEVVALASEKLAGGGQVLVGGNTFFSDFELSVDKYGKNTYSNYNVVENALRVLAAAPELEVSKIKDVRVDADNDNLPDRFGEKVVVEGYVTAASNAAAPGNSFFDVLYIQDETGGLTVFGVSTREVKLGQKVRLTGKVSSYLGDSQISISSDETDLQIIDENINLVAPTKLSTSDSMLEEKEGLLVQVEGTVTRIEGQNIFVDDGSGESRVYTEGYIESSTNLGVADEWKERVKVGDKISAIGLASEDPEGHRLRVRDSAEIVVLNEENPEKPGDNQDSSESENGNQNGGNEEGNDETVNPEKPGDNQDSLEDENGNQNGGNEEENDEETVNPEKPGDNEDSLEDENGNQNGGNEENDEETMNPEKPEDNQDSSEGENGNQNDGNQEENDEETVNPEKPENNGNTSTSEDKNENNSTANESTSPQTGDAGVMGLVGSMICGIAGLSIFRRKRK